MKWWRLLVFSIGANVVGEQIYNATEKRLVVDRARKYADALGKPVLNYACKLTSWGDVNCDVVPRSVPNFVLVSPDSQRLPFEDKQFGATLAFHCLEHHVNPMWILQELNRVSEAVFIITPKPWWLGCWLAPEHKWIFVKSSSKLEENVYFKNPLYLGR